MFGIKVVNTLPGLKASVLIFLYFFPLEKKKKKKKKKKLDEENMAKYGFLSFFLSVALAHQFTYEPWMPLFCKDLYLINNETVADQSDCHS